MPTITDWLMVVITFVYVGATIFICKANLNSAKATRDQLAEMKREHDENVRMSIMPYFEVDCERYKKNNSKNQKSFMRTFYNKFDQVFSFTPKDILSENEESKVAVSVLNLKNVGVNIATSICIRLEYENIKVREDLVGLTIRPGEEYCLNIASFVPSSELNDNNYECFWCGKTTKLREAEIILEFDDILDNHYLQIAHISFTLESADGFPYRADIEPGDAEIDAAIKRKLCDILVYACYTEPPLFLRKTLKVERT